ncbi:MAG: protein kinase domain-containing protein [Acidobacteriota bacterium]
MSLITGTRIGPYEITALLGTGGMGEVYRARDTKLDRDVALKVLPDLFASDPDRLARFEREAKTLASLNHPNIAQIHGLEETATTGAEQSGGRALVMELVEGPTLADRIGQGAIPLDEALAIAKQMVEALEAAHGQGIVHRDLKPANIKITPGGIVKSLDFGLAKAMDSASSQGASAGQAHASMSPTITTPAPFDLRSGRPEQGRGPLTMGGMILGTAAYMAPEQARGRAVDKRADIWAFGCVLYEMLTGTRLFAGDDLTLLVAAIVKDQPDLAPAPAEVRRLLRKCLEKDPRRRLRDIGDAFELIEDSQAAPTAAASTSVPARRAWLPWAVAALATIVAVSAVATGGRWGSTPEPAVAARFQVPWPTRAEGVQAFANRFFEVSPNGRSFAIVANSALWVRGLGDLEPVRLDRTDGATYPFWSPDSEAIGFFADGELKTIARTGGTLQRVAAAPAARGGAWAPDGTIVFAAQGGDLGLSRVSAVGGAPTPSRPSRSRERAARTDTRSSCPMAGASCSCTSTARPPSAACTSARSTVRLRSACSKETRPRCTPQARTVPRATSCSCATTR